MPTMQPAHALPQTHTFDTQISLLRVVDGGAVLSVADVVATVEAVAGAGDVLFVRLYEGRGAAELGMGGGAATAEARLKTMLPGLVDIPIIMEASSAAAAPSFSCCCHAAVAVVALLPLLCCCCRRPRPPRCPPRTLHRSSPTQPAPLPLSSCSCCADHEGGN